MHIAVIGSGGREHALAVKSLHSHLVSDVHVIPGNTGMLMTPSLRLFHDWDGTFQTLEQYLIQQSIELIIVGNESYLAQGIADYFKDSAIQVFGPSQHNWKPVKRMRSSLWTNTAFPQLDMSHAVRLTRQYRS